MSFSRCRFEVRRLTLAFPFLSWALASCDSPQGEALTDGKPAGEVPVLVRLGSFESGEVSDKLPVSADLEAIARADVVPEMPGIVLEVLRREGDAVRRGDPIVHLLDEPLKLAVEQKRILAAQAKGRVAQAELASREGTELARQKKLLLEKARSEYERIRKLADDPASGIVSPEQAEAKRYELEQAEIDHRTCLLQGEKFGLEHAQAIESEKLAAVELRTAEYNLSRATLRSPIDGRISYLAVKLGELVSASARVFTVVDTSKLEARLHVPQKELSRIREGLDVAVLCDVFPGKEFRGSIEVVNPVVDKLNGTIEVIVGVTDPESFLKPGMFVSGEIVLDTRRGAVLVPKKAVSYENQEPIIFLVKENVARRYVLRPGYSTRDRIEVLGLTSAKGDAASPDEGMLVLIGHNNLKEGSKVEVE